MTAFTGALKSPWLLSSLRHCFAIGGYYGARLIQSGADVTFLVRPKRLLPGFGINQGNFNFVPAVAVHHQKRRPHKVRDIPLAAYLHHAQQHQPDSPA